MNDFLAEEDDVRYAYRLLLGREPDSAGFDHYKKIIAGGELTTTDLAGSFLNSSEFAKKHNRAPVEVGLDGFCIFISVNDRDIGAHIMDTHEYEPHVTAALRANLCKGAVFVDVGANIGFFTNLAAHLVGAGGKVIAIEPMDKNLQLIYRSLDRNAFDHVHVYACAASDAIQLVRMATGPRTSNGQMLVNGDSNAVLYSQAVRLDDLFGNGLERIDLVKFDIEGFELRAWKGFQRTLMRCRPVVLSEFHPWCMREFAGVEPLDYLRELFEYGGLVSVLPWAGGEVICESPEKVMVAWEEADKATQSGGKDHLDLLVRPRA